MIKRLGLFGLCVWILSGCYAEADSSEQITAASVVISSTPAIVQQIQPQWVLRDKAVLKQAQQSLHQLPNLRDKTILVYDKIHFFDGTRPRIELSIQDPNNPEQLLFYTYENGTWSVSIVEETIKNLNQKVINLDQIDFSQAADIAKTWAHKAQEVQAVETTPYYVAWVYLPKQSKIFWHTPTLEAVGKQYYLSCHQNGEIWEFKRIAGQDKDE